MGAVGGDPQSGALETGWSRLRELGFVLGRQIAGAGGRNAQSGALEQGWSRLRELGLVRGCVFVGVGGSDPQSGALERAAAWGKRHAGGWSRAFEGVRLWVRCGEDPQSGALEVGAGAPGVDAAPPPHPGDPGEASTGPLRRYGSICGAWEGVGMRRSPLPTELKDVFSVAQARLFEVSASRLRARDLARPFPGIRRRESAFQIGDDDPEAALCERVSTYALRMTEHQFFSHVSAAILWGLPAPARLVRERGVDVAVLAPRRTPIGAGVIGHTARAEMTSVLRHPILDVAVASPASVWAQMGAYLHDIRDVVALADAVIRVPMHPADPPALARREELEQIASSGRHRGAARLRVALTLMNERSRSRPESWLRLLLGDEGCRGAEPNFDVVVDGCWQAQVDLAFAEERVAVEYEGEHHLTDPGQWAKDIERMERLADAGWRVIRVTKSDVFQHPERLLRRVRAALAVR